MTRLLKPTGCTCGEFVTEGCPAPEHVALVGRGAIPKDSDDDGDYLEREIAERTRHNPDYPRLLAEAEAERRASR